VPDPPLAPELPPGIPSPGETFAGKYLIEGVLGVGGMGAVLAARHLHLDEKVAIKLMLPDIARDATTGVRFLREARAAVKIKSEHVAKVTDFGELESGQAYMVMEYLVGEDIDASLRRCGMLSVADTVDILLQASEPLAHAHALGIVHRDLKPGNLFLTTRDDGTRCVKVLDFGISKGTAQDGSLQSLTLTKTQATVGSPVYMAPEQMRAGQPLDARTDIWSLGVVGYELLTGRVPFDANSMFELTAMVLRDDPAPMNRPDVPVGLSRAIQRCLAKKPGDRFPDLPAFAAAIAPFGAKGADELALRVSRARKGKTEEGRPSGPSLSASTAMPSASLGTLPVLAETEVADRPLLRADARTAASWTGPQPPFRPQRRMTLAVGLGFAALAVGGGLLLWRARPSSTDSDAAPTWQASSVSESATAPSASPTPTGAPQAAPSPGETAKPIPGATPSTGPEAGAASPPRKASPPVVKKSPAPPAPTSPRPQPPTSTPSVADQRKN
jgi:serine/threonine protein kinase